MMELEGRDSAKCRKSKKKDMIDIIEIDLNDDKDEIGNSVISYIKKEKKNVKGGKTYNKLLDFILERECSLSLGF